MRPRHIRDIRKEKHHGKFKFPTAYTILFILIAPGRSDDRLCQREKYQMATNATPLGKEVPVAGTYARGRAHPRLPLFYSALIDAPM